MDSSRLRTGELVAGGGGFAMFVFLFFDWFSGGAELTGSVGNLSVSRVGISGWDALTDLPGFLIMLAGVSGIALACLAAAGQRVNIPVRRGGVTATLGLLAILLILWRMVAGSPTLKIGIFLGLAAAIAITVGALMALAEDGFQPLVAVATARTTTVAAASAPPATPAPPPAATAASSASKRSTAKKSSTRSGGAKRSSGSTKPGSTHSRSTKAKGAKSTRSTASKKSPAKSRSSGSKRSSSKRKK